RWCCRATTRRSGSTPATTPRSRSSPASSEADPDVPSTSATSPSGPGAPPCRGPQPEGGPMTEPILEMRSITKRFPGVVALKDVSLTVHEREIHGICGENGAGKSTLMKVLSGVAPAGSYEGEIHFRGRPVSFATINDAEAEGVVSIDQELALVPHLRTAANICRGNEQSNGGGVSWPGPNA